MSADRSFRSSSQPTKVTILGKDTITVDHGIWLNYVAEDLLRNVKPKSAGDTKFALVTDTNISALYVPPFRQSFESWTQQLNTKDELLVYEIPPGETSKSRDTVGAVHDWLAANKFSRDSIIIALGGGVVGDMIGYAAATYMRGVSFVQVPTTLLAMVDSSIGGKTAIDTPFGKNLVGAFWQPARNYIDLDFLDTLPKREFINGMAEVIKTAAIWSEKDFAYLEDNAALVASYLTSNRETQRRTSDAIAETLKRIVLGSVRVKAEVVSADEKEAALRNILNFGHSIGHAYEAILTPQILHGECVSIGMVKEAELSRYLGKLHPSAVSRLVRCLSSYGLPLSLKDETLRRRSANKRCPLDDVMTIMAVDKKNQGPKKRIVLLSSIGKVSELKATVVADEDIRVILSNAIKIESTIPPPSVTECLPAGSKSISNRALILAALGKGKCRLRNLLFSDDTEVMITALTKLGCAEFTSEDNGKTLVVDGKGGYPAATSDPLYLGNAGTASRFLTTVAALVRPSRNANSTVLTGNARMKERPVAPLVDALVANGVEIKYKGNSGCLPLEISAAGGLNGRDITLSATISSQYVSSILMCAPLARSPVTLRLVGGKPISSSYIAMTTSMMSSFGIKVQKLPNEEAYLIHPSKDRQNPSDYTIESDASSATYPLAIAAITGTTCTVPSIGSSSLQGDARFAIDVLKPMGCSVTQSSEETTVTGPPVGRLKSIGDIDMEPMTDAFMTAAVLAAVAGSFGGPNSTKIVGIANQRQKECNRIKAMKDELAKFGVECREHDDGIEIFGRGLHLKCPDTPIHCYDDHRIAMSFSVLSFASSNPMLLDDRECVSKTWPGWWGTLSHVFKVPLQGLDMEGTSLTPLQRRGVKADRSIFFVGMRGAGKTTAGRWAETVLRGWEFTDLDEWIEEDNNMSVKDIVKQHGWKHFRELERAMLDSQMKKGDKALVSCGGGIVEYGANRELLSNWQQTGGIVILISRSIDRVVEYLHQDETRPAYGESVQSVWERRRDWYKNCSNYQYHSSSPGITLEPSSREALAEGDAFQRFLDQVTGRSEYLQKIKSKPHSSFVSLTFPQISPENTPAIQSAVVGADAVELRVDLLEDEAAQVPGAPSPEFVLQQASLLRATVGVPIVFTIRSVNQGGKFPNEKVSDALELYKVALRLSMPFIDVETTWPSSIISFVLSHKGHSKIIASHHDFHHSLSWSNGSWYPHYNAALALGDIVKLVGQARKLEDNDELESFRRTVTAQHSDVPLIAINMGALGQLSRIRNSFMTPVTHAALSIKAAPGQLSVAQINQGLHLMGIYPSKKFYIFGDPVGGSPSPALHNAAFQLLGLPHSYHRFTAAALDESIESILDGEDFGGASVTIPVKRALLPAIHKTQQDVEEIGALNTIVPFSGDDGKRRLSAYNTDYLGIMKALVAAGGHQPHLGKRAAMIIGGGGTARAAACALSCLKFRPIYLVGRNASKLAELAAALPESWNVRVTNTAEAMVKAPPVAAVAAVPATQKMDPTMAALVDSALQMEKWGGSQRTLVEMAYRPANTEAMGLAERAGWKTVPGLEVLVQQGVEQFALWTGYQLEVGWAREVVLGAAEGRTG